MWNSSDDCCGIIAETSQNDCDYVPPEKKEKKGENNSALQEALECCKNKQIGVEEASALYGVPKRSLRSHLKNNNYTVVDENFRVFVLPVIPPQAEIDLACHIKELHSAQVTLTPIEVRRLAYEVLSQKYNIQGLPNDKNCLLGRRWYETFTGKYLHLHDDHSYMKGNEDKSASFYNALETLTIKNHLSSNRIYTVDAVELKFRASAADDWRRVKLLNQRKMIYTDARALCCTNPLGNYVPPVFLIPPVNTHTDRNARREQSRQLAWTNFPTSEDLANIQSQIKNQLNRRHRSKVDDSEEELREKLYEQFNQLRNKMINKYETFLNGVTPDIFFDWFKTFVSYVGASPQKKVLLLLSEPNHLKSIKTLEFAKQNGVLFLAIPIRSLHKIHPLDGFTMSLNRNLSTCARSWLIKNPDFNGQEVPFKSLFDEGYSEAANPAIAKNGFLYSGIWPVNRNVFKSMELGGESLLLQRKSLEDPQKIPTGIDGPNKFSLPGITKMADLQKLCRVCMKEKMYMKPIFEPSERPPPPLNYYGKKILDITNVPVVPNDGMPEYLCQLCQVQLMDVSKVKMKIVESHGKLLNVREAINRSYYDADDRSGGDWSVAPPSGEKATVPERLMEKIRGKSFDINSVCRICMGEKPLLTSIFFKSQDAGEYSTETCRKIAEIAGCQVHLEDGLSASICPFCRTSINKTHEFVLRVINSDKRCREIVAEIKSRTN